MKFNENRWYRITDAIGQNTFIFTDKVISDTEVEEDDEDEIKFKIIFPSYKN